MGVVRQGQYTNVNAPNKREKKNTNTKDTPNLRCSHIWMMMRSRQGLEEPDRRSGGQDSSNIETNDLPTSQTWWA